MAEDPEDVHQAVELEPRHPGDLAVAQPALLHDGVVGLAVEPQLPAQGVLPDLGFGRVDAARRDAVGEVLDAAARAPGDLAVLVAPDVVVDEDLGGQVELEGGEEAAADVPLGGVVAAAGGEGRQREHEEGGDLRLGDVPFVDGERVDGLDARAAPDGGIGHGPRLRQQEERREEGKRDSESPPEGIHPGKS